MEYNGAAIIAMKGRDCVAIAADRRFGVQAQTVATNFQKIFEMGDRLYIGLPGLKSIGFQIILRTKYVPNLVKIHRRMLILECSQGCYAVKISPSDLDL
jgi:20S proteasome subunit beta 3